MLSEAFLSEMLRYVAFGDHDRAALRRFAPLVLPHRQSIAEAFYARLQEHSGARMVFTGPDQIERLKGTLHEWLTELLEGPWDDTYLARRARIGRVHVRVGLEQRYMFGAMNVIRLALMGILHAEVAPVEQGAMADAVHKILDLELAIMLETYREAFVERVQSLEREHTRLLERRLVQSEERYEQIVEASEALIVTMDAELRLSLVNGHAEDALEQKRDAVVGRSFLELFVPGDLHGATTVMVDALLEGRRPGPLEAVIPGGGKRRVRWHFTTLPDAIGRLVCAIGLDITEEHEATDRASRAERLASLGTMAAGLAHEIRNPLNAAHLQLTLLERRLKRPAGADLAGAMAAAGVVGGEMRRLAELVEEFLQFARPQPLRIASMDLRQCAEQVVALMSPEAAAAGKQLVLAPGGPVHARLEEERIKQVVHNLVRNAVEAAPSGGRVHVRVDAEPGWGRLEVEDDGPGLPAHNAPIFEPFYTTKPGGTGLGLAIVSRIVGDHGGEVGVESRPGRTIFRVRLPAS